MRCGHSSRRGRNNIQGRPESLHYFPIHVSYTRNEVRGIPHKTFQFVSMDMPNTNARLNLQPRGERYQLVFFYLPTQVFAVLTINIIEVYDWLLMAHLVMHCLNQGIVHVYLSTRGSAKQFNSDPQTYCSPFWKSIIAWGTKHPCLTQAHPPILVDANCLLLLLA